MTEEKWSEFLNKVNLEPPGKEGDTTSATLAAQGYLDSVQMIVASAPEDFPEEWKEDLLQTAQMTVEAHKNFMTTHLGKLHAICLLYIATITLINPAETEKLLNELMLRLTFLKLGGISHA